MILRPAAVEIHPLSLLMAVASLRIACLCCCCCRSLSREISDPSLFGCATTTQDSTDPLKSAEPVDGAAAREQPTNIFEEGAGDAMGARQESNRAPSQWTKWQIYPTRMHF